MNATLRILLLLSIVSSAFADDPSSQKAAEAILEATNAAGAMKAGFLATIDPMIANMKQQGMPDAAGTEIRIAMTEWFDQEIKWSDIKPKLVELYVQEFTGPELNELLAFYQTPLGKKAIVKLPVIMRQGSMIGQEYAAKNQESLKQKIQAIVERYRPK
jgi:hypothetical protein